MIMNVLLLEWIFLDIKEASLEAECKRNSRVCALRTFMFGDNLAGGRGWP